MPRFPMTTERDASDKVAEIYSDFCQRMGFAEAPNFMKTQGIAPSVLAGSWGLVRNVLLNGKLPRATKELIFLAVAMDRECEYCTEAHAACCRMLGVEEKIIQSVKEGLRGPIPAHTRNILLFSIKCATAPQELDDEDFAILEEEGLSNEQVLEVIAMSSLALYATTIAEATMIEPDTMFVEVQKHSGVTGA